MRRSSGDFLWSSRVERSSFNATYSRLLWRQQMSSRRQHLWHDLRWSEKMCWRITEEDQWWERRDFENKFRVCAWVEETTPWRWILVINMFKDWRKLGLQCNWCDINVFHHPETKILFPKCDHSVCIKCLNGETQTKSSFTCSECK